MKLDIFGRQVWKRWFVRHTCKQYIKQDVKIFQITRGIIVNEHKHGFGVFDNNFKFVKASSQKRKKDGQFIPKFNHKNIPYIDEDVIFVGNVYPQFGHFLLEHMNRAYALLYKKYKNMKVVLINNKDVNPVPNYMIELLKMLGAKDVLILNETTQFKNVYIPEQGFNIPIYSSNDFGKTYAAMADNVPSSEEIYDKVYVSRSAMNERKTFGEEFVQEIFKNNGYKIIWPEQLPLTAQIGIIKNCKCLAGCAGTALHLALFMKPGGTVIQIKRNRILKDNSDTQYLINNTVGLNSVFVDASIEKQKTDHGAFTPQIIGLNKYMRLFFDKNNFIYDKTLPVFRQVDMDNYDNLLQQYNEMHGGNISVWIKRKFIHLSACFIPGRENRGNYRRWLKRKLKLI